MRLRIQIVPVPRKLHEQVCATGSVLIGSVGQSLGLALSQLLQLQVACCGRNGEAIASLRIEIRLLRQLAVLVAGILIAPSLVIRVAEAAQFIVAQGAFCSRLVSFALAIEASVVTG